MLESSVVLTLNMPQPRVLVFMELYISSKVLGRLSRSNGINVDMFTCKFLEQIFFLFMDNLWFDDLRAE